MNRTRIVLSFLLGLTCVVFLGAKSANIASLIGLSDVDSSTPTSGNVLRANGSVWLSARLSTSDVDEGSSLFFTDERVDDRSSSLLQNGTGISWSYNDGANTLTPTVTLAPFTTDALAEGSSNKYFTDERVDDRASSLLQNGTGISWTYNDGANTLTPNVSLSAFTTDSLAEGSSNKYFTDERVDDRAAALLVAGTGVSLSYNDGGNSLTVANTGVTSVALSLPAIFSVSGSPVTTTGTLTASLANQSANLVFSGAESGGAAAPTFRSLVDADIPSTLTATARTAVRKNTGGANVGSRRRLNFIEGNNVTLTVADDATDEEIDVTIAAAGGGSGTVTSVALTVPAEFSVSGSPVTTSGTLAVTKANQSANQVFAGPTSGGAAAPAFRALVSGDIPSHNHSAADVTSGALALARGGMNADLSSVTDFSTLYKDSSTFVALSPNTSTTRKYSGMTGTGSAGAAPTWTQVDWSELANKPSTFTPSSHTHSGSDITSGSISISTDGILPISLKSANYSAGSSDCVILCNGGSDFTITLPVSSVPNGKYFIVKRTGGAGLVSVNDANSTALYGPSGTTFSVTYIWRSADSTYYRINVDPGS
jgi:hypothetical protein